MFFLKTTLDKVILTDEKQCSNYILHGIILGVIITQLMYSELTSRGICFLFLWIATGLSLVMTMRTHKRIMCFFRLLFN